MDINMHDRRILKELGHRYAEAAVLDCHEKKRMEWKQLNRLEETKPLVLIDQLPWHELNLNHELDLLCSDPFCRELEDSLRKTLYKWEHFPVDMVIPSYIPLPKVIHNSGFGVSIKENIQKTDDGRGVASHEYMDVLGTEEELARLHPAIVTYDEETTMERYSAAEEIFEGILPVRLTGICPEFRVWDEISMFRGVTPILYDLMDRPDFIHETMEKFTEYQIDMLHQFERLNLLEGDIQAVNCSGAFTDELPQGPDTLYAKTGADCWAGGMAQMFSSCSNAMHEEFEIAYAKRYYAHIGLVYYGCCEPLHNKIDIIRQLPNVRKISISPWADPDIAASNIGRDYVLSRKPSPSLLATNSLDETAIEQEIIKTLEACKVTHTPCEFILKDLSTIRYRPEHLVRWAEITRAVIERYY